jgi:hypothetical protein
MSTFPGSPRLQKGALIGVDPLNPLASVVVFQYNPETLHPPLLTLCDPKGFVRPHAFQERNSISPCNHYQ